MHFPHKLELVIETPGVSAESFTNSEWTRVVDQSRPAPLISTLQKDLWIMSFHRGDTPTPT
jgi:hypothetical protein